MIVRKLGFAIGLASLLGSAIYFFVYLARWEWNRALISGMLLLIVEVLVLGALLLGRLSRVERAVAATPGRSASANRTLEHLRHTRPSTGRPFAWLDPTTSRGTNVFVPVLMGAGVVVSALAWLVERVARVAARPGMEVGLANSLDTIAYPSSLLVADEHVPAAVTLLEGPTVRR